MGWRRIGKLGTTVIHGRGRPNAPVAVVADEQTVLLPEPSTYSRGERILWYGRRFGRPQRIGNVLPAFLADPSTGGEWGRFEFVSRSDRHQLLIQTVLSSDPIGTSSRAGPELSDAWETGWHMTFTAPTGETFAFSVEDVLGTVDREEPYTYTVAAGDVDRIAIDAFNAANGSLHIYTERIVASLAGAAGWLYHDDDSGDWWEHDGNAWNRYYETPEFPEPPPGVIFGSGVPGNDVGVGREHLRSP